MRKESDILAVATVLWFVAMAIGGIALDIVTGTTTAAAIFISILTIPAMGTGIWMAILREKGR